MEVNKLNIPVISFNTNLTHYDKILYPVNGNFERLNNLPKNILFLLLNSILKYKKTQNFNV